ncbi:hypothetical protein CLV78_107155 [Aliiruegeria haliotis]|uniref:Uncharacterized protein n=1 Tax=Aliiruegeria haliotis TaxID=1280846 RepID=A0A2T0RM69_9RHOB|nr:hypothetical protein CLV78_107155 [Aliiruegeria haliotis]
MGHVLRSGDATQPLPRNKPSCSDTAMVTVFGWLEAGLDRSSRNPGQGCRSVLADQGAPASASYLESIIPNVPDTPTCRLIAPPSGRTLRAVDVSDKTPIVTVSGAQSHGWARIAALEDQLCDLVYTQFRSMWMVSDAITGQGRESRSVGNPTRTVSNQLPPSMRQNSCGGGFTSAIRYDGIRAILAVIAALTG